MDNEIDSSQKDEPQPVPGLLKTTPSLGDLVGGVSVAMVLIPQAIAYATVAGLPAEVGLFAASIPLVVAAPFVSCPWIQTGPTALTSLLAGGALAGLVLAPAQLAPAAALLALVVGVTRLLMGILRIGSLTKHLIRPVILGFTTAAAILIICSQLSKTLGTSHVDSSVIVRAFKSFASFQWSIEAIAVAISTVAVAHYSKRIHRLFPSIFLAIILAILYSALTGYTGATVGALGGNFISFRTDLPWTQFPRLLLPGIIIATVGFAEPTSISITLMEEENLEWNPNRELCGGGFANIFSGLFGGYPVGGSFSRTTINKMAGATSVWSGLITGCIVLCMLCFTPLLSPLPQAALGAIIILAVVRLIKFKEIIEVWAANRIHGAIAVTTLLITLFFSPEVHFGILIGAALGVAVTFWDQAKAMSIEDGLKA